MIIQQIRNATLIVQYANKKFLIDPVLADKGAYPPFLNTIRQDQRNPMVDLPTSIDHILQNIDAVIATHLHSDHFDARAMELLPKDVKLFVQNETDAAKVATAGFHNIEILCYDTLFHGIILCKTQGHHGRGEILTAMGNVSGVIFQHPEEKSLYIAGDTVYYEGVNEAITTYQPEIIIVNGGANQILGYDPIVMGKEDIYEVAKTAPNSIIISSHMEAMNHWTLSRQELRDYIVEQGIASQVLVPEDGETYTF
jgi:L-ascorbate metabolism protein UlaG (beta-lactamase superfamily)